MNVVSDLADAYAAKAEPNGAKPAEVKKEAVAYVPLWKRRYFKPIAVTLVLLIIAVCGYFAWLIFRPKPLGDGFASGNGRLEAVDFDVSAKSAGRISEIYVSDGDYVTAGQIVARMDAAALRAQMQQAEAQEAEALNAIITSQAVIAEREGAHTAALTVVTQREAEQNVASITAQRSLVLSTQHAMSMQEYDNDSARARQSSAAVLTAKAQVAAAYSAIMAARSQTQEAQSRLETCRSAEKRIQVELADIELKSARAGRVQFRITQPGEVVAAGGKVISMIDVSDVFMTFYLPEAAAGRVAIGSEARIVLDAMPNTALPAVITFVDSAAQFTPKTVETATERDKLVFRVKATVAPDLLRRYASQVKSGLPGVAYVRLDPSQAWPDKLTPKPQQ